MIRQYLSVRLRRSKTSLTKVFPFKALTSSTLQFGRLLADLQRISAIASLVFNRSNMIVRGFRRLKGRHESGRDVVVRVQMHMLVQLIRHFVLL